MKESLAIEQRETAIVNPDPEKTGKALAFIFFLYPKVRFVRVNPDKTPYRPHGNESWKHDPPPTTDELIDWIAKGGTIAIVPGTVDLAVIDIDEGDPVELQGKSQPRFSVSSRRPGGIHSWFDRKTYLSTQHIKKPNIGCKYCVIAHNNYVILWNPLTLIEIAKALRGRNASSQQLEFPLPVELLTSGDERKSKIPSKQAKRPSTQAKRNNSGPDNRWKGVKKGERNTALVEALQCKLTEKRRADGQGSASLDWTQEAASEINASFNPPLLPQEARDTARSVYKSTERARREWAYRGRQSGRVRCERVLERDNLVIHLHEQGMNHRQLGCLLFMKYPEDKAREKVRKIIQARRKREAIEACQIPTK